MNGVVVDEILSFPDFLFKVEIKGIITVRIILVDYTKYSKSFDIKKFIIQGPLLKIIYLSNTDKS